ncbi:DMT family transporter [Streptomyces sp. Caat 7-52]|uniref:DMT family transporter n=1 Tax=Streptomyces sp. Caat 7-52 TaxID=2949637 RepID=UPI002034C59B|nr:DMT family transporter [Streptomyces sp. Caat 7-52]
MTAVAHQTRTAPAAGTTRPRRGAAPLLGVACAALATVVWSGSLVTARGLHDSVPPVQHAFWRWVIALLAVAPFGARQAWRQRHLFRRHARYVLLASLLGVAAYNTLVNQAGLTTPAATMGMIMAASPVLMAVFERLGGVRLGARRTSGLLLACAGVALLVGGGADFSAGALWMPAAACCFAGYSALLRRRPAELGGTAFLFTTFLTGTVLLVPAQAVSLAVQGGFRPSPGTVLPLLYVGVASSALAFFAWNKAVALIGATRAGIVYYLQPVCVALLSWAVLGEHTSRSRLLCLALILAGVVLGAGPAADGASAGGGRHTPDRRGRRAAYPELPTPAAPVGPRSRGDGV